MKTLLPPVSFPAALVAGIVVTMATPLSACIQGYRHGGVPVDVKVAPRPVEYDLQAAAKVEIPRPPRLDPPAFPALPLPAVAMESTEVRSQRLVREFEARPKGKSSFEDTTDYAVALIFLGRHPEAIKVLLALEKERPGVYTTAANLGTAFELTGNLPAALKWIQTGIERHAGSHDGTEWLHVAILRAKINLRTDAGWLEKHSVLDVADRHEAAEIVRAIEHQLGERLQFVQPADPVVCDLFYQAALRVRPELRTRYLEESRRFGDLRKTEIEALAKS